MFDNIVKILKRFGKTEKETKSKDAAKERLHLVLMQDRANISADFLALMKQEIIEVIKKYIDVDDNAIDVRLTNKTNEDGTTGAPVLYANIPIVSVKEEAREEVKKEKQENNKKEDNVKSEKKEESKKKDDSSTAKKQDKKEDEPEVKKEEQEQKKDKETEKVIEEAKEIVEEIKENKE